MKTILYYEGEARMKNSTLLLYSFYVQLISLDINTQNLNQAIDNRNNSKYSNLIVYGIPWKKFLPSSSSTHCSQELES